MFISETLSCVINFSQEQNQNIKAGDKLCLVPNQAFSSLKKMLSLTIFVHKSVSESMCL